MNKSPEPRPLEQQVHGSSTLQGTVEHISFADSETGFTVLRIAAEKEGDRPPSLPREALRTAVGPAPWVAEGQRVRLQGRWSEHARHGYRFAFDWLEVLQPSDTEGLVRYLSSGSFRGIGAKLARRIAEALGPNALRIICEKPDVLARIPGLKAKVRQQLVETARNEISQHELLVFLRGVGLGPEQAVKVQRKLGPDGEKRIRDDPYLLSRTVSGIGFATADRIAAELGLAASSPTRVRGALLHALERAAGDGHTLLLAEALFAAARELVREELPPAAFEEALESLSHAGDLEVDASISPMRRLVYLPGLLVCERELARNLDALVRSGPLSALAGTSDCLAAERRAGLTLHPDQRAAVLGLASNPVALLTGGPGVGKTTIVRLLADLAERAGQSIALASPTGRAAKRLAEASGREAATIHRLLGFEPHSGRFAHGRRTPLSSDLLVVDEISMLDVSLAHHLLQAIAPPTRLALVGDPDQLPSVGPGNVLRDLLRSGRVPTFRLTQIYRQSGGSLIVENAHRILRGEPLSFPSSASEGVEGGCYFFACEDPSACADLVVDVVTRRIPGRFGLEWIRDVQVLAPMYRGPCGVDALNALLREALGMGGREVRRGERIWRMGDRVIHTRNDYEKQVFNGDMGRIADVTSDGRVLVSFPDQDVRYERGELDDLSPAFAITVHRAQGSEYPCVVVPLLTQHYMMLQRNLLYTAITRARTLVVLVGSRRALQMALDNAQQSHRQSALAERLAACDPAGRPRRLRPQDQESDPNAG
jgi:exodeoxyribonuclease V alpha subunit